VAGQGDKDQGHAASLFPALFEEGVALRLNPAPDLRFAPLTLMTAKAAFVVLLRAGCGDWHCRKRRDRQLRDSVPGGSTRINDSSVFSVYWPRTGPTKAREALIRGCRQDMIIVLWGRSAAGE